MDHVISPSSGLLLLLLYGIVLIIISLFTRRGGANNVDDFLLARRKLSYIPGAISVAVSWIWAPALFIGAQKAYQQGIAGALWFLVPNVLALVVFIPFALKLRKRFGEGVTLPQYVKQRFGRRLHILYLIQFLGLQICSFAVQILAGASLIQSVTGLDYFVVVFVLVSISLIYSVMGGIRASVGTDVLQYGIILIGLLIAVPWAISAAGGIETVFNGLGGYTGEYKNAFDPWVAYSFGISVTIGLLSGPIGDQQHWQRAFALKEPQNIAKAFGIGALLFAVVPILLSCLGFIAAAKVSAGAWTINDPQMVGPEAISMLLPSLLVVMFVFMLIAGLSSTLDSALVAGSSLIVVDLLPYFKRPNESEKKALRVTKYAMVFVAVLGTVIALIPGIKILHLFLFWATWRAATMIPSMSFIFNPKLPERWVFVAVAGTLILSTPLFVWGSISGNVHLKVISSVVVVVVGFSVCWLGRHIASKNS